LRLARKPDTVFEYDNFTNIENPHELNSTPAYVHKSNIGKKIRRSLTKAGKRIHKEFSIIKTKTGYGYSLASAFRDEVMVIERTD
jgi:hypothetical protein